MFRNAGEKIKFWAKVIFWSGTVLFTIGGLGYISEGVTNNSGGAVLLGILLPLCGAGLSWVCSLFIYGFGKLIVNTDILIETQIETNEILSQMQYKNNKADE